MFNFFSYCPTPHKTFSAAVLIGALTIASACTTQPDRQGNTGYRTIPTAPGRDVDRARELTNLGVAMLRGAEANFAGGGDKIDYLEGLSRAEQNFRGALEADIMYGPAHNNLGRIFYLQEHYYEAAWEFQYASQLMPHRPIPRNNMGLVFEATGRLDKAEEHYALALDAEPDNPEFLGNLARAKVRQGEQSAQLLDLLQQIVLKDHRPQWRDWAQEQQRMIAARMGD